MTMLKKKIDCFYNHWGYPTGSGNGPECIFCKEPRKSCTCKQGVANSCLSLSYFPCIALGGLEAINFWAGKATFYLKGALLITIQQHTS